MPASTLSDVATRTGKRVVISYSEIISALSYAIDLTEGALPGHALRTCLLGMRLAKQVGVPRVELQSLYYALLLKDIGCSSNAARLCQIIGGDDRVVKDQMKRDDWDQPHRPRLEMLKTLWREVLPHESAIDRIGKIVRISLGRKRNNQEMFELRCDRGAAIAHKLGLSAETSAAIQGLDEHWNGSGYPRQLARNAIPLHARILAIAQHLDGFACEGNKTKAIDVLRQRSGTWFDPALVKAAIELDANGLLWEFCESDGPENVLRAAVIELEPDGIRGVGEPEIDRICEAFADVVDAKSPFTYRHSIGVAEAAVTIGSRLHLVPARLQLVRRAALLHDLGKLGVPNTILDKPGKLTAEEWLLIAQHSRLSREILARIASFAELAFVAGAHHERLDGSGYPDRLRATDLSLEARIIAVADVYAAMTELRPYRAGMPHAEAMAELRRLTPDKLDTACVDAISGGLDLSHTGSALRAPVSASPGASASRGTGECYA